MRWTQDEILSLFKAIQGKTSWKEKGIAFRKAARQLGKSEGSCRIKYARIDPKHILSGCGPENRNSRPWEKSELAILYNRRHDRGMSFIEIGELLGRSPISCERQYQVADWDLMQWIPSSQDKKADKKVDKKPKEDEWVDRICQNEDKERSKRRKEAFLEKFIDYICGMARGSFERFKLIDERTFIKKLREAYDAAQIDFTEKDLPMPFQAMKKLAYKKFESLGMTYPEQKKFGKGRYLVVGDSHGKHTRSGMFDLFERVIKELNIDAVVHIGHMFDDDDDVSYLWQNVPNLVVVGMRPELGSLKRQKHRYDVYRERVCLGKLVVGSQYDVNDFSAKFVGNIDQNILPGMCCVINSHRHEMFKPCQYREPEQYATYGERIITSPGCLCERHINKVLKEIRMPNGIPQVRVAHPFGYSKYNRQERLSSSWEQGLLVVDVESDGGYTIHPCRIRGTSRGYTTSYFDKIITQDGCYKPDDKIFFNGDLHVPHHDRQVLDIQEQFCKDYRPSTAVNVGDALDNRAINHHIMERTHGPTRGDFLSDVRICRHILSRMRFWAPNAHMLLGNHERFIDDFVGQYPQMASMLDVNMLLGTKQMNINLVPLKRVLHFGAAKFIHGDQKMYGQNGSKMDKVEHTFGTNTIMGNLHYPRIRKGCYMVGFSGIMDQGYNEIDASQWMRGFGYCNIFDGKAFISLVNIEECRCSIGGKSYSPRKNLDGWNAPDAEPVLEFRKV